MPAALVQHSVLGDVKEDILMPNSEFWESNKVEWRWWHTIQIMQRNNMLQTWTFPCSACLSFWKSCSKHGKALRSGDDDAAWIECSTTWNVGNNFEFCLGQKEPMGNLNRFGFSQDLLEAYWLLTNSPAPRHWALLNNEQLQLYGISANHVSRRREFNDRLTCTVWFKHDGSK
jgi:hypothetical protein